ncbi:HCP-like protein [Aureobasidium subglaciale]|nr:HCP-like protein [Aureobasidium subglaciale]KAI5226129.1 HCP-like protein [Aureobasidium subglaciale]KAI5229515.1 HCP-like protein [Aureobasidium subglaciale]KAI5264131.1 HCP-like protein [Aureobasidium subglaciale]
MAYHSQHTSATFVPGGMDDYYMPTSPALVAPAPQRYDVRHIDVDPQLMRRYRHMPEMSDQIQEGIASMQLSVTAQHEAAAFPQVPYRGRHIPQTDGEFESVLEAARVTVLNSNDPDMQLAWAQDALQYVTICLESEDRLQQTQPPRPQQPQVEHQIMVDAINIVTFLADQHHPKAEFMRGMWNEFGRFGCAHDKREAFRCYARAADRGYARACYRLGMLYENANDEERALDNYRRGVGAQDSASLYRLGMITLRGQYGQPKDFATGLDLIRRSADSIDENAPQGAYVYGMLLARQLPQIKLPEGVLPYDEQEARRYIENSAFCRFSKAQLKMASAYELASLGCEFDPALSLHYNRLAARQGEPEADMAISKWFLVGHEGLFPKHEELSYIYANRAAHAGLSTAEFAVGYFNELGIHVPRNIDLALQWYNKAAANGNKDAQGRIDSIARRHILSKNDHENVALSRIKSQHGSMRGQRPPRFQAQIPRIESISEGSVSPHPRRNSSLGPPPSSTPTPYPLDDRPPTVPPPRSTSTAPYPLEDLTPRPTPTPGPTGGFLDTRPATTTPTGRIRANTTLARPDSAASTLQGQRPMPGGARPPGHRTASGPVPGPRPQPGTSPRMNPTSQLPPVNSRLDIGYTAPPDTRPPPSVVYTAPQNPVRHSSRPPTSSSSRPATSASSSSLGRTPTRVDSATPRPSPGPSVGSTGAVGTPPPGIGAGAMPKPATPSKPAKTGPKTFEEMGVPKHKQEQECIVM